MEKSLEEVVFIVEEAPDGGYIAKALGVSIITEADDLETLRSQVLDAHGGPSGKRRDGVTVVRRREGHPSPVSGAAPLFPVLVTACAPWLTRADWPRGTYTA